MYLDKIDIYNKLVCHWKGNLQHTNKKWEVVLIPNFPLIE